MTSDRARTPTRTSLEKQALPWTGLPRRSRRGRRPRTRPSHRPPEAECADLCRCGHTRRAYRVGFFRAGDGAGRVGACPTLHHPRQSAYIRVVRLLCGCLGLRYRCGLDDDLALAGDAQPPRPRRDGARGAQGPLGVGLGKDGGSTAHASPGLPADCFIPMGVMIRLSSAGSKRTGLRNRRAA